MPWGLKRFHHSGQSHFVTFCCYHRRRLFTTPDKSSSQGETSHPKIAKSAIFRMGHPRRFRIQVYGYVVREGMASARVGSEPRLASTGRTRTWGTEQPVVGLDLQFDWLSSGSPTFRRDTADSYSSCLRYARRRNDKR